MNISHITFIGSYELHIDDFEVGLLDVDGVFHHYVAVLHDDGSITLFGFSNQYVPIFYVRCLDQYDVDQVLMFLKGYVNVYLQY